MSQRPALTKVEALVALSVVTLLLGLVLTGIGRVRETAAETTCKNYFKQFGLGVHKYTDVNSKLPPLVDQGEGSRTGKGLPSYFATLMPYMEAMPYYFREEDPPSRYHGHTSNEFVIHAKGYRFVYDGGVVNDSWRVMTCPTDATASRLRDVPMTLPDGSTGYYATGSYAANGMIPSRKGTWNELIPRGTSNTILIAERPQICTEANGEATYNLWGVGFYSRHMPAFAALTPVTPPEYWSTGLAAPAGPWPDETAADRDAQIRFRVGWKDAPSERIGLSVPFQRIRAGQPCDPRLPGTPHRGGMQAAMADGSVRTFTHDVGPWVFWTACLPSLNVD